MGGEELCKFGLLESQRIEVNSSNVLRETSLIRFINENVPKLLPDQVVYITVIERVINKKGGS